MEQTLEGPETLGPTTAGFPSLFRDARVPTQGTFHEERWSQIYVSGRQPPTTKEAAGWRVELFPRPSPYGRSWTPTGLTASPCPVLRPSCQGKGRSKSGEGRAPGGGRTEVSNSQGEGGVSGGQ